jgi:hypothetical protein
VCIAAARSPPRSEPAHNHARRPSAPRRSACSAALSSGRSSVIEEAGEGGSAFDHVIDRLSGIGVPRQPSTFDPHPRLQLDDQWWRYAFPLRRDLAFATSRTGTNTTTWQVSPEHAGPARFPPRRGCSLIATRGSLPRVTDLHLHGVRSCSVRLGRMLALGEGIRWSSMLRLVNRNGIEAGILPSLIWLWKIRTGAC